LEAKKLFEILKGDQLVSINGAIETEISALVIDSRKVEANDCFIAVKGLSSDGHDFIESAIEKGAASIVCEVLPGRLNPYVVYAVVKEGRTALALLAHHFYDNPSAKLNVVGVTGTNGKTTVATLLYQLFTQLGFKCGLLSTVENIVAGKTLLSTHTTPDAISIAKLMSHMYEEGCEYIFMEVSSHALDQKRTLGIDFKIALFTNITHDHLDYHLTFLNYINAKKIFFDGLSGQSYAIVNYDDKNGKTMVQNTKAKVLSYGLHTLADYHTKLLSDDIAGLHLKINNHEVMFSMTGAFNAYNITAVFAASQVLNVDATKALSILSALSGAEGRMEKVIDSKLQRVGIVDYAHTPDALENVLKTLRKSLKPNQKLITVVGCGGDRDAAKRPIMAGIAAALSDNLILTSDNPRSEDPEAILTDMQKGLSENQTKHCLKISDRLMAIKTAVMIAAPGDVILVAGKGHEKYQEIKGEKFPFEDKKILSDAFSGSI
jgi:UDP-N-acetylmuramoyl-L-alanyl-D-glutamate--2,6-diaminopimelate ligase